MEGFAANGGERWPVGKLMGRNREPRAIPRGHPKVMAADARECGGWKWRLPETGGPGYPYRLEEESFSPGATRRQGRLVG